MTEQLSSLAREILNITKAQLLVNMRFLDRALFELVPEESEMLPLATDGKKLYYQPVWLLKGYRGEQSFVLRGYLHALLHCIFRHMFVSTGVDRPRWDLACDMAVQAMMDELNLPKLHSEMNERCKSVVERLRGAVNPLTAEKIYRWLEDEAVDKRMMLQWSKLFYVDDHEPWYSHGLMEEDGTASSAAVTNLSGRQKQAEIWREISERMLIDMETFGKHRGNAPGNMLQALRALNREKCDYADFLRKFASRCEVMKLSPDEFEYNYYVYGLSLYKDMPLIEPLEYREDKRIRDFVIAIDTSGSVQGEIVQQFLQKTFNILKQQETFDRRFNIHIIQCDAAVQEDAVIHTQDEFDEYIKGMVIKGFGGTDFRPIFGYVEKLRREHAFRDLKGLIYFTDGYGVYPAKPTDYQTAFIFLAEDHYDASNVPPWAIRAVVDRDQIREL